MNLAEKLEAIESAKILCKAHSGLCEIRKEDQEITDKYLRHAEVLEKIEADLKVFYTLLNWINRN